MNKVKYTYNYVLWEIEQRIGALTEHEKTAMEAEEFDLAERMRIRREEFELFLHYLKSKKENKETALLY